MSRIITGLGPEIAFISHVRYVPDEYDEIIARFGDNLNPSGVLDPKRAYAVKQVDVRSSYTKVWLADAGGPFNSVHFVRA